MSDASEQGDALLKLPPGNRTRRWIEEMMAAGGPSDAEMYHLMLDTRDTTMWQWRERAAACWYLGHAALPRAAQAEAAGALADALADTFSGYGERGQRWMRRTAAAAGVAAVACLLAGTAYGVSLEHAVATALLGGLGSFVLLLGPCYPISGQIEAARLAWVRRQAALGLRQMPCPEHLPSALKAMADRRRSVREPAWGAACAMLRATSPEHYGRLGAAVPALCRLLPSAAAATQAFLIDALGRFGDGRAVAPIESLLQQASPDPAVAEAAARALPVLRLRREQEGSDARLLRPATSPEDAATLLRPAAGAGPGDDELLLRPVEGEPE